MLHQHMEDMRDGSRQAELQVLEHLTMKKRLEQQRATAQDKVRYWEGKAVKAVQVGSDELAREALKRKLASEDLVADLDRQIEMQREQASTLKAQLAALKDKLNVAQDKKVKVLARHKAEMQMRRKRQDRGPRPIDPELFRMDDSEAFREYDRMSNNIDRLDAEVEANRELDEYLSGGSMSDSELEERFRKLEKSATLEDDLASLKRRLK